MSPRRRGPRAHPDPAAAREPGTDAGAARGRASLRWLTLAAVLLAASVLLLANLGDQRLWQDEAETALVSGTILTHGIPLGSDGRNSFSQELGQDYGKGQVSLRHPWLAYYVLAGCFAALGRSTLAARLPFALFGIATVVLACVFATSLWRSRRAGLLAALILLLNVPFLLLARQCRYYAPDMFFALLALHAYCRLLERRRLAGVVFALSAILLFHTQYVHYAALLAAVGVHALLFHRDRLRPVLIAAGVTVLANAPWIAWFAAMGRFVGARSDVGPRTFSFAWAYLQEVDRYIFPALLLLVPLLLWLYAGNVRPKRRLLGPGAGSRLALLLLFVAAILAAACLTSAYPFFRYVAPAIPVACLVTALLLDSLVRAHRLVGTVATVLVLGLLARSWSLPDYLYEITHHYEGPVDGIVRYLGRHARQDDVVAITYEDLPVKFYTGLRVVGGLTGEDLSPARSADWVIIRKYVISEKDQAVRQFLLTEVPQADYDAIRVPSPDVAFQNREEPDLHRFRTAQGEDDVTLFHRRAHPGRGPGSPIHLVP